MQFFLSHWHCILPGAVLLIAMFFMNRGNKKDKSQYDNVGKMLNAKSYEDEQDIA